MVLDDSRLHPGPRDDHAVHRVELLAAKADPRGRPPLGAGGIGVADVRPRLREGGTSLQEDRAGQGQDREPSYDGHLKGPLGYMISASSPPDFTPSEVAGRTWASRPSGWGSLAAASMPASW